MSMPRKIRCTVESIIDHGGRVYTIDLKPSSPVPAFRPGQFMHLTVEDYDPSSFWPESRVFSIASSSTERAYLRLCYSVKGTYTTKMENSLEVGKTAWVKLPYGDFVVDDGKDAVLIAGGTGISAFLGFLENLSRGHSSQTYLIYGARSPDLLLFNDIIQKKLQEVPSFQAHFFTEQNSSFTGLSASFVNFFHGRISLETIWPKILNPDKKAFYLSGPPQMLKALTDDLKNRGVPEDQIHMDAWE